MTFWKCIFNDILRNTLARGAVEYREWLRTSVGNHCSSRIRAVEHRCAGGMAHTQGCQVISCETTKELRMHIKYAMKLSFFMILLLNIHY